MEDGTSGSIVKALDRVHEERIREIEGMPQRTLDSVWWPFTQHGLVNKKEEVMVVDSAFGDNFDAYYAKSGGNDQTASAADKGDKSLLNPFFDGSASWFT